MFNDVTPYDSPCTPGRNRASTNTTKLFSSQIDFNRSIVICISLLTKQNLHIDSFNKTKNNFRQQNTDKNFRKKRLLHGVFH